MSGTHFCGGIYLYRSMIAACISFHFAEKVICPHRSVVEMTQGYRLQEGCETRPDHKFRIFFHITVSAS